MADKPKKPQKLEPTCRAGWNSRPGGDRRHAADGGEDPRGVRALRLRAGGNPRDGIHRRARQALPDRDRPNEGVFSFQDDDEQWISLRYDLTAPLARYVAENLESSFCPNLIAATAPATSIRNEKPGPGRFSPVLHATQDATVG